MASILTGKNQTWPTQRYLARKKQFNRNVGLKNLRDKLNREVPPVHDQFAVLMKAPGTYYQTIPTNLYLGNNICDCYPYKLWYTYYRDKNLVGNRIQTKRLR